VNLAAIIGEHRRVGDLAHERVLERVEGRAASTLADELMLRKTTSLLC
jgi:hypothetical protein